MGELGAGDVNGRSPSRVAMIRRRSIWKPSDTSSTRRFSFPENQWATASSEADVLAPAGSPTTAPSGSPAFRRWRRPTSDSLTVSPDPTPPVARPTGASPRWYSAAAWSSRARNTGDGRPLYCAAPSTAIASAERASSCAPVSATATTTAAQPKVSAIISVTAATTLRRRVQKGMGERQQEKAAEGRGLKAQPVVELHQEHVGRGIEKHLVTEIMCEIERGVEQIDGPRLAPDEEQGGAWPVLPPQHRVRAEGAHTTVGVRELEAVGRDAGRRVHGVRGRAGVIRNGRAVVPSVHVESECTGSLELLEVPVASREGERLRVQLEAECWTESEVQAGRQVELALAELPEDVADAVGRSGGRVVVRRDELRGGEASDIARPELERHRRAGTQVDHRGQGEGPGAAGVTDVLSIQATVDGLARV